MNVLDLAIEIGLQPKRLAATNGGEYHSPCPDCEGKDRFCMWPNQRNGGGYWCRQCDKKGDAIQFCRDFLGLSYKDACMKVGVQLKRSLLYRRPEVRVFTPSYSERSPSLWRFKAEAFAECCQKTLMQSEEALEMIKKRGITIETAKRYGIGYNSKTSWEDRMSWGLAAEFRDDGRVRKQWLPRGLVVSTYPFGELTAHKLKIRRTGWKEGDIYPKYVEVSGSQKQYAIYGDTNLPIIVVEAELDAILLQQEVGDVCCSIATGGAGKKPDREVHLFLGRVSKIIFSLDFDEAGKREYEFWRSTYRQVVAWPAPIGKSPSEAFLQGVDLKEWLQAGLSK